MTSIADWIKEWDPDLIPEQHCGYWCGPGWHGLIKPLCKFLSRTNDDYPDETPVQITQIKEKFGRLRFYTSACGPSIFEAVNPVIQGVETLSAYTCEDCGDVETALVSDNSRAWLRCQCNDCSGRNEQGN